jgi:hypothetical protein
MQDTSRALSASFSALVSCLACSSSSETSVEHALNLLVREERYWPLYYMPLHTCLHNLLNFLHLLTKENRLLVLPRTYEATGLFVKYRLSDFCMHCCKATSKPIFCIVCLTSVCTVVKPQVSQSFVSSV